MFCHAIFDVVYSLIEDRVSGGGILALIHHFADWCGMEEVTQLVYGLAMKK